MHNVVNMRIGGVYRAPDRGDVEKVARDLGGVVKAFLELASFVLSIRHPEEVAEVSRTGARQACLQPAGSGYPHHGGRVVLDGSVYSLREFYGDIVRYTHVPYSTAIHCRIKGGESYIVGPFARLNQFYTSLNKEVRDFVETHGWRAPPANVMHTYVARVAELYDALLELERFFYTHNPPHRQTLSEETSKQPQVPLNPQQTAFQNPAQAYTATAENLSFGGLVQFFLCWLVYSFLLERRWCVLFL